MKSLVKLQAPNFELDQAKVEKGQKEGQKEGRGPFIKKAHHHHPHLLPFMVVALLTIVVLEDNSSRWLCLSEPEGREGHVKDEGYSSKHFSPRHIWPSMCDPGLLSFLGSPKLSAAMS
ncbi:predicted protein [Histoplasma capsulatum G186AR]|uniref:Uncharacterized protein n=1 Tax=Ajellomyces capsulatus (strain G186AR / H82 / ATCC MYA-2454 / RMSCC 2432) TaxID=447093 RepID=C0NE79_AJECG|nr:uncharacterized protein HCBG_02172 [Histoplasma capsulatum G186AR]EEH10527.1 predicted protein [Histoplasma capsulatum G186AR]